MTNSWCFFITNFNLQVERPVMHIYFELRLSFAEKNYHFNKITTKVFVYMLIDYKMLYFIVISIIFILYSLVKS